MSGDEKMNNLNIKSLYFNFRKKKVLEDISLDFCEGINVVLGPNGCGKSTLLKLAATIYPLDSGEITLNDISYKTFPQKIKKEIAYLPQNFDVYPTLKVIEFLKLIFNVKVGKCDPVELEKVMEITGVNEFCNVKMKKLSEGMRQLVGIAQAIIGDPKVIILDEPTAGLDPEHRRNFNSILKTLKKDRIILISTHIIEDIMPYYDSITVIENKRVVFYGKIQEFLHSLDGKAFNVAIDAKDYEKVGQKYIVLGESFENGKNMLKITGDIDKNEFPDITPCSVDVTDLWNYYRKKYEN